MEGVFSCRRRIPIIRGHERKERKRVLNMGVGYQKRLAALRESTTVSSASDCSIFFWVCTMTFLLVSWSSPFRINSSRRKYAYAHAHTHKRGKTWEWSEEREVNKDIKGRAFMQYLVKVENDVKLAHISKVFVKGLHKSVNDLQCNELIVIVVNRNDKVQAGITAKPNKQLRHREKKMIPKGRIGESDRL